MSINIKLILLGAQRTGTNSLFTLLKQHPEIARSEHKEVLNHSNIKTLEKYIEKFDIKNNTKYILDGTPAAYDFNYNTIKNIDIKKKIIYPIRNPFDRYYSIIKLNMLLPELWLKFWNKYPTLFAYPDFKKNDDILDFLPVIFDSKHLKYAFEITDDIFIFRLDKINLQEIFNFLELNSIDIELEIKNTLNLEWNKSHHKKFLDNYWNKYITEIAKIILNELEELKKYIDIEDWIEEANNILSKV